MSRATVELDFFAKDKNNSSKSHFNKLLGRQRSFRDIQSAISRINPQLLKSVIAFGSVNPCPEGEYQTFAKKPYSLPSTPREEQIPFPALPAYTQIPRPPLDNRNDMAPLTIFYNGKVSVFNVTPDKAETIFKLAEKGIAQNSAESTDPKVVDAFTVGQQLLESDLNGDDLPMARRKSLQKFLEKRKGRLTSVSPFPCRTPTTRF